MKKTKDCSGVGGGADGSPHLSENDDENARQGLANSIGAHKRKKRSPVALLKKVVESEFKLIRKGNKLIRKGNKSLMRTVESQHQEIRELKSKIEELQQLLALRNAGHKWLAGGI